MNAIGGLYQRNVEKLERTEVLVNFKRAINKFLRIVIDVLRLGFMDGKWWLMLVGILKLKLGLTALRCLLV